MIETFVDLNSAEKGEYLVNYSTSEKLSTINNKILKIKDLLEGLR